MMRMRRRRREKIALPEVNLTPLIDMALTLLVIFMVTAPMIQNNIKIDLPKGNSREVSAQQEFVVSVNNKNIIFFNNYPVEKSKVIETIAKAISGQEEIPVFVRAHKKLEYGDVLALVEDIKQAGAKRVALSIEA